MGGIFLDASSIRFKELDEAIKYDLQQTKIKFEFPNGLTQLRLIEECRALNALDMENPDNFDLMFDITMQMLVGKTVFVYFVEDEEKHELGRFLVTDRYMNLRSIDVIDEYPILVNWLVEFVAGMLSKKFPRSLKDFQATMSEREERLKSLNPKSKETKVRSLRKESVKS